MILPHYRDPIHGFIEVSRQEQKIIDSSPFQRLRNIKQLATTYLVYHGAEHTRFGHSIGVMHLATRAFKAVTEKNPLLFREDPEENKVVTAWYLQILRLIALTHDLGHAPFSHASEALFAGGKEHEDYTKDIIEQTEIADYINEIGELFQRTYGEQYGITPQLLWKIYGEDPKNHMLDDDYIWPDFMFLKSFMDGEMDCDKMDYLLRDSHYCGVSYGTYDLERFISTLTVYKKPEENILQLAINSGGIQAFEEFVLARYFMFIQVYFHKTRRYLDHLLEGRGSVNIRGLVKIRGNVRHSRADNYEVKSHGIPNIYQHNINNRIILRTIPGHITANPNIRQCRGHKACSSGHKPLPNTGAQEQRQYIGNKVNPPEKAKQLFGKLACNQRQYQRKGKSHRQGKGNIDHKVLNGF